MTLEQEIYMQLLELYARDLEVDNTSLELQVAAFQIMKDYTPPVIQPSPYQPNPWNTPIWYSADTTYETL